MNRAEMIKILRERISDEFLQPVVKRAIPKILDELFEIIKERLEAGEELRIAKFGAFKIKEIKKEGEEKVRKLIRFIPSKK